MLQGRRIAVVVPAFNEARHIERVLAGVPRYVDEIVVVDDGSQDNTSGLVRNSEDGRVVLVKHGQNRGVGHAILTGYEIASGLGAHIAVVMAGDGQMHPDDMPNLLLPLLRGEADYVKGERLSWPGARSVIPRTRQVGITVLEVLTRLTTGVRWLRDCQCGYTALRLDLLNRLPIEQVYGRYGFPNDLLNHLVLLDARIEQRPVRPIYEGQRSDLRITRVAGPMLLMLGRGLVRRARRGLSSPSAAHPSAPSPRSSAVRVEGIRCSRLPQVDRPGPRRRSLAE